MKRCIFATSILCASLVGPAMANDLWIPTSPDAVLSVCWEAQADTRAVDMFLEGAEGGAALLLFSFEPAAEGDLPEAFFWTQLRLVSGRGQWAANIADAAFPPDLPIWVTALFQTPMSWMLTEPTALMLGGASEEKLDFDWAPYAAYTAGDACFLARPASTTSTTQWMPFDFEPRFGRQTLAGELITHQWASAGVQIRVDNRHPAHPDAAIIFDSSNPTGEDFDLMTPGYGPDNALPEGKLLIIAEDLVDLDGDLLVDDPDDESLGGVVTFEFDEPVVVCSVKLLDLDMDQPNEVRFYDDQRLCARLPFVSKADNCATRLETYVQATRRVEIDFGGSGGIASLGIMACPTRSDFDWTRFASPTQLRAGEVMTDQMAPLGIRVRALNAVPGLPDKALVFDTAAPTGDDDDLVTPGYGIGNVDAQDCVLIVAENDIDADGDGLVDVPDDAEQGGVLVVEFTADRWLKSVGVLDVDANEFSWIELYDAAGELTWMFPLEPLGDNSLQDVPIDVMGVRRFELHLGGSGALTGFEFCPEVFAP